MPLTNTSIGTGKYLTLEELCETSRLSAATVYRLKLAGKIPFFQPAGKGGRILFPADAIEQACRVAADPTVKADSGAIPERLSGPRPAWMRP